MADNIEALEFRRTATLQTVKEIVAERLGYGAIDQLTFRERISFEADVRQIICDWEETVGCDPSRSEPIDPFEKLLFEHQRICERISQPAGGFGGLE